MCLFCCCCRRRKVKEDDITENVSLKRKELIRDTIFESQESFPRRYIHYYALHSNEAQSSDELGLLKHDHLRIAVEDITDTWSFAENINTNKKGLVPMNLLARDVETEIWYFAKVSRFMAETLLLREGNELGTFLVRLVQPVDKLYALSVRHVDDEGNPLVKHYKIYYKDELYYISNNITALSLQKLIQIYLVVEDWNDLKLCTKLTNPCPRDDIDDDDFSTDELELNKDDIHLNKEPFSSGNFGNIYKAKWNGRKVAVKILKTTSHDNEEFLREVIPMKKLRHRNVVTLHGVCAREEPFCMILEYMEHGNLLDYMHTVKLALAQRIYIIQQVADGMAYLESKKYIHRDIAARNILLKKNLIAKLSDFGLSRYTSFQETYTTAGTYALAIRWLAPESFCTSKFSSKSDVWAFALLVMEIFTEGKMPYYELDFNRNYNVLFEEIKKGYVMSRPPSLPEDMYKYMLACWCLDPKKRPSFLELFNLIEPFKQLPETFTYIELAKVKQTE